MIRSVLTIFFRAPGTHPWAILACLLAAGLAGGISLASLLPLFSLAADSAQGNDSQLAQMVLGFLAFFNLEPEIVPLLSLLVCGFMAKSLLTLVAMTYVGNTTAKVSTDMRTELIDNLLRVRWSFLTSQPMGRLANVVSVDATRAGLAYRVTANFLSNALQAIIYITVAFFVSWKLSVLALVTGLSIILALHGFVRMARRAGFRQTQRTSELVTYLTDALNSIKPLKAMARQDGFALLFERKIKSLRTALRRQVLSKEMRRALEQILTITCVALLFYAAVALWEFQIAEILVMGVLLLQTLQNVGKVQEYLQEAAVLESAYLAVHELIAEARQVREPMGDGGMPSFEQGAQFQSVDFAFGKSVLLKNVNLDIPRGFISVITGPSGAGKTTLIDLLMGLYEPDRGDILIDGVPLRDLDKTTWRRMIGYVPQELILFHDTIYANVALGDAEITEADAQAALEAAGAWEFVRAHPDGMAAVVGEKGAKLSGGQRQRIALARALALKPRLLILDEVTSALDSDTERDLCRQLKPFARDMAILAISHRPSFYGIADRLYRIDGGRLSEVVEPSPATLAQPA